MTGERNHLLNYFAIGSMMNPIGLSNRNIVPTASEPAILEDFALKFFAPMGFAEAVPDPGAKSLHGVVHTISDREMEMLDDIEGHLYYRQTARAQLYKTRKSVDVTVYCRNVPGEEGLPQERYLDVMMEGARHYGVADAYIQALQNHPKQPRPAPSDFLSFGPPPDDKVMTLEEVKPFDGLDGHPLYITVNGKVLEIVEKAPHKVGLTMSMRQNKGMIAWETWLPKVVYDPKYGIPKSIQECPPEYSAYMEHMAVERIGPNGARVVARLLL